VERLITATENDKDLQNLIKAIRKGHLPAKPSKSIRPFAKFFDQLTITDSGLIMKGEKIILPSKLIDLAIRKAHQGGHPGITTMKRRIRSHFYFPRMDKHIENAAQRCRTCAMFTSKNRKNKLHPQSLESFNAWEKVSIDLFGPLPDKRHIIVAQDMLSKFPAAKILSKTDAEHVIDAVDDMYTTYGTPLAHRTDNGPPFNSSKFAAFSENHGIKHETSFPYHPQANPVETVMKPLGKAIKAAHSEKRNTEKALNEFLSTYRATPHSSTGLAPGDILLRHGYGKDFPKKDSVSDQAVRDALERERQTRQDRANALNESRREENYEVGDKIFTRNENRKKFQPIFGPDPMTITSVEHGGVTCQSDSGRTQRRHCDDIKPAPVDQEDTQEAEPHRQEAGPIPTNTTDPTPHVTRPHRDRRSNPKYKDFVLY
jgi:hypothetical protein